MEEKDQQPPASKIQIYPTSTGEISPFWREKYERDAKKYWDIFYKRHQDKFFKDRHYLDKEWGQYFSGTDGKVILEELIHPFFHYNWADGILLITGWLWGWKYHLSFACYNTKYICPCLQFFTSSCELS